MALSEGAVLAIQESPKQLIREESAADYLHVSLSTLRRWRKRGVGPQHFRLDGVIRYRKEHLDLFIQNHLTPEVAS
jgi:hypothetical protein